MGYSDFQPPLGRSSVYSVIKPLLSLSFRLIGSAGDLVKLWKPDGPFADFWEQGFRGAMLDEKLSTGF